MRVKEHMTNKVVYGYRWPKLLFFVTVDTLNTGEPKRESKFLMRPRDKQNGVRVKLLVSDRKINKI